MSGTVEKAHWCGRLSSFRVFGFYFSARGLRGGVAHSALAAVKMGERRTKKGAMTGLAGETTKDRGGRTARNGGNASLEPPSGVQRKGERGPAMTRVDAKGKRQREKERETRRRTASAFFPSSHR